MLTLKEKCLVVGFSRKHFISYHDFTPIVPAAFLFQVLVLTLSNRFFRSTLLASNEEVLELFSPVTTLLCKPLDCDHILQYCTA